MAGGLLLTIVLLLTIDLSSGKAELDTRGIENEEVWGAILYGYVVDEDEPSYLRKGDRIFEVNPDEDIAIAVKSDTRIEVEYSDSEHTAAQSVAASMSVAGGFGAFSAAASMSVSKSSDSSIKTVRLDSYTKALRYEVSAVEDFRLFPDRFVTDAFKEAVTVMPVEQIERMIGVFYATSMHLGGEIRKSYTMQATKEDNAASVTAELQAKYGPSFSAKTSVGVTSRSSDSNSQMNVEWSIKGGDTMVWLQKDFTDDTDVQDVQSQWSNSITDDNLYPFNFELGLVWDIIKAIDLQKGNEYEKYLTAKWEANKNLFQPTKFLEAESIEDKIGCWDQKDRNAEGTGYDGKQDTTISGIKCQNWNTQSPHSHGYYPAKYQDKGLGDHNYCRNPAAKYTKVWCYTSSPGTRWDWCDVPTCVDEGISCWDRYDRSREGSGYQGQQSKTRGGYTCQKWSSQSPNSHGYTPESYAAKGVGFHNYCRNPAEKYKDVWCYTTSSSKRWDWCDVPTC